MSRIASVDSRLYLANVITHQYPIIQRKTLFAIQKSTLIDNLSQWQT